MKTMFRSGDDYVTERSSNGETWSTIDPDEAQSLVNSGDAIIYDTQEAMMAAIQYSNNRAFEYPSIEDQLDQIYHEGIDAWKETIKAVKDAHPKPE
tara:strand:- start:16 stop:303 length:288 start_codon:yes stop_codon:yes gene_type:complete